jgi:hypothetical protein
VDQTNRPYFGDEVVFLETYDVRKIKESTSDAAEIRRGAL